MQMQEKMAHIVTKGRTAVYEIINQLAKGHFLATTAKVKVAKGEAVDDPEWEDVDVDDTDVDVEELADFEY
jgi:hypothetical protein